MVVVPTDRKTDRHVYPFVQRTDWQQVQTFGRISLEDQEYEVFILCQKEDVVYLRLSKKQERYHKSNIHTQSSYRRSQEV